MRPELFWLPIDLFLCLYTIIFAPLPFLILYIYKQALISINKWFFNVDLISFDGLSSGGIDYGALMYDRGLIVSNRNQKRQLKAKSAKGLCQNIGVVINYEGPPIPVDLLREDVKRKFLAPEDSNGKYLNFWVYLVKIGGHVFRRKLDTLEIDKLVYEIELVKGETVEQFLATWENEYYKPNWPLWEIVSIADKESNTSYFAIKIHHGLADGITLSHFFEVLFGVKGIPDIAFPQIRTWQKFYLYLAIPRSIIYIGLRMFWISMQKQLKPKDLTDFRYSHSFGTFELDKLKVLQKQSKVAFHPMLQTILAEALLMMHKDKKLKVPKEIVINCPLPWRNNPYNERMCNWLSMAFVPIPFGTIQQPEERLRAVHKSFTDFVRKGYLFSTVLTLSAALNLGLPLLPLKIKSPSPTQATWSPLVFNSEVSFFGRKVVHCYGLMGLLMAGIPLTITSVSNLDRMDFALTGSTQVFTQNELDRLNRYLKDVVEHLYTITCTDINQNQVKLQGNNRLDEFQIILV